MFGKNLQFVFPTRLIPNDLYVNPIEFYISGLRMERDSRWTGLLRHQH